MLSFYIRLFIDFFPEDFSVFMDKMKIKLILISATCQSPTPTAANYLPNTWEEYYWPTLTVPPCEKFVCVAVIKNLHVNYCVGEAGRVSP